MSQESAEKNFTSQRLGDQFAHQNNDSNRL